MRTRTRWIAERRQELEVRRRDTRWRAGEHVWWRGALCRVDVAAASGSHVTVRCGDLTATCSAREDYRSVLEPLMRACAVRELPARLLALAARHGLAYLTEDRKGHGLLLAMPMRPNLTLLALERFAHGLIDEKAEDRALDTAIAEFDIRAPSRSVRVGNLSGGNQQKLLLAKTMLVEPDVVIVDEPTRGIDIGNKSQIYDFIDAMVRAGKACIVISSEMPELVGLADRVLVMRAGRIVAELRGNDINEENVVYAATTGGGGDGREEHNDHRSDRNNPAG